MAIQINEALKSEFADSKQLNSPTIRVDVEMCPSQLCDKLAREILLEVQRISQFSRNPEIDELSSEDILKYLKTLIWMRCQVAREFDNQSVRPYRSIMKFVAVPVLVYQLLISIGKAYDKDYAIEFLPAYSISESDLLAPEELQSLSDLFRRLENSGMKLVYKIPFDPEGELDFMALCHVEGIVTGYRKSHPVYGFLASFFEQKKLNEITGTMCRVTYGYASDYEMYVTKLYQVLGRGGGGQSD